MRFYQNLLYKFKRLYHFFKTGLAKGLISEIRYRFPARKLKIIAITGTDGKTTSSTLLYQILQTAGKKVALVSTVAAFVGEEQLDTGFHVTNPAPDQLQRFMRRLVDGGYEYLVLETTSQGIYQYRNWGIFPLIAGITNVAQDHFDYHLNYKNYLQAKAMILRLADHIVLNKDDQSYEQLRAILKTSDSKISSYSREHKIEPQVEKALKNKFSENYNYSNGLLVYELSQKLGLSVADFIAGLEKFAGVPGRMQEIISKKHFRMFVDFAHTPQGLEAALTALKKLAGKGRLIAVYGCAGKRDKSKRPLMGEIGVRLADYVILTAEDPRTEDIWSILREMKENLSTGHNKVISLVDREQAIAYALTKLARAGDIVGIFGKGHEQSMNLGGVEYPWDDRQIAQKYL